MCECMCVCVYVLTGSVNDDNSKVKSSETGDTCICELNNLKVATTLKSLGKAEKIHMKMMLYIFKRFFNIL